MAEYLLPQEIKDVLIKTADYLIKNGWKQNNFGLTEKRKCLVGALLHICEEEWDRDIFRGAIKALEFACDASLLMRWNDDPIRTQDDVVNAIRLAVGQNPIELPY